MNKITELYNKLDKHGKRMAWITAVCVVTTTPVAIGSAVREAIRVAENPTRVVQVAQAPVVEAPVAPVAGSRCASTMTQAIAENMPFPSECADESPTVAAAPAPEPHRYEPTYEFTATQAMTEICTAARQYSQDFYSGYMSRDQVRRELSSYSRDLAKDSPAGGIQLMLHGKSCSGLF